MRVFGIAGRSGSGKTTLIEKLIPLFLARSLKVSAIKHAHHDIDIDKPGKDSYRFRAVGASEVVLLSGNRLALMREIKNEPSPELKDALLCLSNCDLVLVEGFKNYPIPKLEVYRPSLDKPPLYPDDTSVIGIASDNPPALPRPMSIFSVNHPETMIDFVLDHALPLKTRDDILKLNIKH
ncbi:MAG: molybdopterin-guanine dinucleotide biosynthesis protein B [Burkholderiales bacterium]|jgi:molybdopterin-guanine dinucleotide biosynthesis protein B|nr:molybdopterin-guanine dinucleotide biosynthesis protein B [Burkholderiales bacterium]